MKQSLFLFLVFLSLDLFSQVNDSFTDGDFTSNPVWSGDTSCFEVTKGNMLRLNDTAKTAGSSYLSTSSSIVTGTVWSFYVHLYFNPTANSYAKFYLAASSPDLEEPLDGYYVQIGGKDDDVSLYRQKGLTGELLIKGKRKMQGIQSSKLEIKVHCDKEGNWTLFSFLYNIENDFTQEGTCRDLPAGEYTHSGIVCVYTASLYKSFVFDDIVIAPEDVVTPSPDKPDSGDNTPPELLSTYTPTDSTIQLFFNEPLDISGVRLYMGTPYRIKDKSLSVDERNLTIIVSDKFVENETYSLSVSGIKDKSGNELSESWVDFMYYGKPESMTGFGDLVFSEVMANPAGTNDLPETEYLELHNRANMPLRLYGWTLHYGNKSYPLDDRLLLPDRYLMLFHRKHLEQWKGKNVDIMGMASFPELANTGKLVWLEDNEGNLVSWVEYSDSWYRDGFKKKGGFSLECIDLDNLSGDAGNWKASEDRHGGTPGKENSVKALFPDETTAEVAFSYLVAADTLVIKFTKPMDLTSLSSVENYKFSGNNVREAFPVYPKGDEVRVVYSPGIKGDEILDVELQNLKDISGYDLEGSLSVKAGLPDEPEKGEILFNEILFDPLPGGYDYVELYNASDKYIKLDRMYFASRTAGGGYTEGIALSGSARTFSPHSYLCFTQSPDVVCSSYSCHKNNMVKLAKLPALPDEMGNILLLSPLGDILDECNYTAKMHSSLLGNKEGVSLEKTYPTFESNSSGSWLSASSSSGGGTPGMENSQYRGLAGQDDNSFRLVSDSFTPDGDGVNDELLISYHFTEENYIADCKVYDVAGRLVKVITEDYRLASQGNLVWNGTSEDGKTAAIGIYVIYIEVHNPAGNAKVYKLPCVLTR